MITLIIGKLGEGKSYLATRLVYKLLMKGEDCYVDWKINFNSYLLYKQSNLFYNIYDKIFPVLPNTIGKLYYYKNLEEIYPIKNGNIFMDEAHRFLNSRDWQSIPPDFIKKMSQSRKYGCNMYFVTQHQNMIDTNVRRLCNEVILLRKFWFVFRKEYYDGFSIDKIGDSTTPAKPMCKGYSFYSSEFAKSYDTLYIFGEEFTANGMPKLWEFDDYLKEKMLINFDFKKLIKVLKGGEKDDRYIQSVKH